MSAIMRKQWSRYSDLKPHSTNDCLAETHRPASVSTWGLRIVNPSQVSVVIA